MRLIGNNPKFQLATTRVFMLHFFQLFNPKESSMNNPQFKSRGIGLRPVTPT